MRSIQHPGQPDVQRLAAQSVETQAFDLELPAGLSLLETVAQAMAALNTSSAAFRLSGGGFESFSYVMPALSKTPAHAVYFSDTYSVDGPVRLESACVTFGRRDGQPWLHSHAIWIEASGRRHCGHLLPDEIKVSMPIRAQGVACQGATFTVCPDLETNFSLFVPLQTQRATLGLPNQLAPALSDTPAQAYAIRVSPNVDICTTLEQFCNEHRIKHARIQGGVGSTVGAVFDDGRVVEPFVTELLIRQGDINTGADGQVRAALDVSVVDYKGGVSEGRLARGQNPVLVTFELVLEVFAS